jgi:hypothetical protein
VLRQGVSHDDEHFRRQTARAPIADGVSIGLSQLGNRVGPTETIDHVVRTSQSLHIHSSFTVSEKNQVPMLTDTPKVK